MGTKRTAWHLFFSILLRKRGPRWLEVLDEFPLSEERPRVDYLLLRKAPTEASEDAGKTLPGLWSHLSQATIVEFESIGRPYRSSNLDRLWGYVHLYYADERVRFPHRDDLRAVLVVPARSRALDADVDALGLKWKELGGGYWEIGGGAFPLFVVELGVIAEQEDDDLLRLFTHRAAHTVEARRFWAEQVGTTEAGMAARELEGYDEVMKKFLESLSPEQRLAGLAPEQLVDVIGPEQLFGALAPEQLLLALPTPLLRALSDEYVATLPEATRDEIRKRIGR